MTQYYWDFVNGADGNAGTDPALPKKTLSAFRAFSFSAGDIVSFREGVSWIGDTADANGFLTVPSSGAGGNPITINSYNQGTPGAKPIIGFTLRTITVTGATSGATTQITAPSHGLAGGDTIVLSNIGGLTPSASLNIKTTVNSIVDSNNFTVAITTAGSYTSGGLVYVYSTKSGAYLSAKKNVTISNIEFTGVNMGVTITGAGTANECDNIILQNLYVHETMDHGIGTTGANGTGAGIIVQDCVVLNARNDGINFQGGAAASYTAITVRRCTVSYTGSNPDQTYSNVSGAGDGVSWHNLCNGDVYDCTIHHCMKGGITHVNTSGTNQCWRNFVYECSEGGIWYAPASGTAVFKAWNNIIYAPVTMPINPSTTATAQACLKVGAVGIVEWYNNTCYNNRGAASGVTTNVSWSCWSARNTAKVTAKGNLFVSDGSAALAYAADTSVTQMVTDKNTYSHSTALFVTSTTKTFAQWQAVVFTAAGSVNPDTNGQTTASNIKGAPPSTYKDARLASSTSPAVAFSTDNTGLGYTDLAKDYNLRARPNGSAWTGGAFNFWPFGGLSAQPCLFGD